jgi:high-affinity nickel-transport protein
VNALLTVLGLGFLLGVRHASDPDHVVAVSTFVTAHRERGAARWLGLFWGVGHSLSIFVVGAAIIVFKIVVPARVGLSFEFLVGLMLVGLGALNILGRRTSFGPVEHSHGGLVHSHEMTFGWLDAPGHLLLRRSLLVGLVHGLAGSAAAALLVLATIKGTGAALLYLAVFGAGTLAGMCLLSGAMETAVRSASGIAPRTLTLGTGLASAAFGAYVMYRIAFIDGLFLAAARWTTQ